MHGYGFLFRGRTLAYGLLPLSKLNFTQWQEAEQLLKNQPLGTFLVRVAESTFGFSLSVKTRSRVKHLSITQQRAGAYLITGNDRVFPDLTTIISTYRKYPIIGGDGPLRTAAQPSSSRSVTTPCSGDGIGLVGDLFTMSEGLRVNAHGAGAAVLPSLSAAIYDTANNILPHQDPTISCDQELYIGHTLCPTQDPSYLNADSILHLRCACPKRQCTWCDVSVAACSTNDHLEICTHRPVQCTLCGDTIASRLLMSRHYKACAGYLVACSVCSRSIPVHNYPAHAAEHEQLSAPLPDAQCPFRTAGCQLTGPCSLEHVHHCRFRNFVCTGCHEAVVYSCRDAHLAKCAAGRLKKGMPHMSQWQ